MAFGLSKMPSLWPVALALGCLALGASRAADHGTPADQDWPIYGRTSDENHFSPLQQIDDRSIGRLGLAWHADLDTPWSATAPVEANGVVYVATGLSVVSAFDVPTGKLLWTYDPNVAGSPETSRLRGPTWGIRGIAYAEGRLFFGTKDGRLIALDAKSGKPGWEAMTLEAGMDSANISGPPRVFKGKVLIGFAGADVGITRGYVTAYDVATGRKLWRFWTVPGDPAKGFENDAMAMAAKTWKGEWWRFGGGGTAWNAMTYDAELNRVYIGTGNGLPWNQKIRSPGGGDNLFLSSIVALDADTGKYIWHYQTTPGESWDYNSTMDIELSHLSIGGSTVPVILHAPKNGFFYVIDRRTGKLLSADPFTKVSWADHIDLKTGRPVENFNVRYDHGPTTIYPGSVGAHNWPPMSFSPRTGLVYIPETKVPGPYADIDDLASFKPKPGIHVSTGIDYTKGGAGGSVEFGASLLAWDPVQRKPRWQVKLPGFFNGGAISTAGNLVIQGRIDGKLVIYAADSGKILWSFDAGGPLISAPITYSYRGRQYITVMTGLAGAAAAGGPLSAAFGWDFRTFPRRMLTFALDAKATLPPPVEKTPITAAADPDYRPDAALIKSGGALYLDRSCIACHGPESMAGGGAPDLRASPVMTDGEAFAAVVQQGALAGRGMPKFDDLTADEVTALREYIRSRAAALRGTSATNGNPTTR